MHLRNLPLEWVISVTTISIEMLRKSGEQRKAVLTTLSKGMNAEEGNMATMSSSVLKKMRSLQHLESLGSQMDQDTEQPHLISEILKKVGSCVSNAMKTIQI